MLRIPRSDPCPFCEQLEGRGDCVWVERGAVTSAFVNLKQFERGSLLVIPNRHAESIVDASRADVSRVAAHARRMARAVLAAFDPVGINLFQNNGVMSGQTVAHYHVHVIPRYTDSNPDQMFRARDFPAAPRAEREQIAEAVRDALPGSPE